MKISGARALVRSLVEEGVDVVFGYPGGAVLTLYDELFLEKNLRHILVRHEQGAVHAADGYARSTGKTGVCIATSGPGACNLTTGIATAYMDSIPLVAITGQVSTGLLGNDAFQEADVTGITFPIIKHSYLIKDQKEIPLRVKEAFKIASTGRKGPVLIDIPKDLQAKDLEFSYPKDVKLRGYNPTIKGHKLQIKKAASLIMASKKAVLYIGGGIISSGASKELLMLAETIDIPVTTTLMGLSAFPSGHPHSLGMLGMHGTKYANFAIMDADLIIAVGVRFDDRVTGKVDEFAPNAKIIHIDIDPAEIGKIVEIDVPIVGDAKSVLKEINKLVSEKTSGEWNKQISEWKEEHPLRYEAKGKFLPPQYVVEEISQTFKDAIMTTDVGQNQMWAAQFLKFKNPRTFLSSGGLGCMGYGLPAAIGAKIGNPEKTVVNISGDGSFMMNCQELATSIENDAPVIVAILNNRFLGMIRQWQEAFYGKRYMASVLNQSTDFVKLAKAIGAYGRQVTKRVEVGKALEWAAGKDKTVVLDFRVRPEENVLPMVPPEKSLLEMVG